VGDLEVTFLGEMEVKELKETILLEKSGEDRVMLEGELGAVQWLYNRFHGTSKNDLTAYSISI